MPDFIGVERCCRTGLNCRPLSSESGGTILFKRFAPGTDLVVGDGVQTLAGGLALAPLAFTFESVSDIVPTWRFVGARPTSFFAARSPLCRRLLGWPASESGALCHGDGGPWTQQPLPEVVRVAYPRQSPRMLAGLKILRLVSPPRLRSSTACGPGGNPGPIPISQGKSQAIPTQFPCDEVTKVQRR
jgi:hypothetical protein